MRIIGLLLALWWGLPALAAEQPFAPPLDRPLRYQTVLVKADKGQSQKISSIDELRFTKADDGYRLHWRTSDIKVEAPPPADAMLQEIMKIAAAEPLNLVVSATGEIGEVGNIAAFRAARTAMLATIIGKFADMPNSAAIQKALSGFAKAQNSQTDAQLTQELTETPSYLTLGAVLGLDVGQELTTDVEMPLNIGTGTIASKMKLSRSADTDDGMAHLTIVSAPDGAELLKAMRPVFAQMFAGAPAAVSDAALKELEAQPLSLEERVEIDYDPKTGLSTTVLRTKVIKLGKNGEKMEKIEIKAIPVI